jgi:4'-phosphopantetheinyl transferase
MPESPGPFLAVWTLSPGADPERDQTLLSPLLDAEERERWARFRDPRDRWSYAAAHGLCRLMLARYAGGGRGRPGPADWRFVAGPHGKPEVDADRSGAPGGAFSISHARGMAACALATGPVAVGVDVEVLDRRLEAQALADRFFHPGEAQWLRERPDDRRAEAFLVLWTLKEAVVKALGTGISQGLESFHLEVDPPCLVAASPAFGAIPDWRLSRWRPSPDHTLALATRWSGGDLPAPERRDWVGAEALLARDYTKPR